MRDPVTSLRQKLKLATQEAHTLLESKINVLDPDLSLSRMHSILESFCYFYIHFERMLATRASENCKAANFYLRDRQKLPWLTEDLGVQHVAEMIQHTHALDLSLFKTTDHLWGAIYVVEGSTLGSQVISRSSPWKFRFFQAYGQQTGIFWQTFLTKLNDIEESKHNLVVESAVHTFTLLTQIFAERSNQDGEAKYEMHSIGY